MAVGDVTSTSREYLTPTTSPWNKVINVRRRGDNNWTFECKDLDTKKNQTLTLNMSGFLEALDKARSHKKPKNILPRLGYNVCVLRN